jgi:DNA-binding protein HU-beta
VNKGGLVAEVAKRTNNNKADVARVLDSAIATIRETVAKGERVSLVGFGTFEKRRRGQRLARNPRKPEIEIQVPARDVPSFLPGQAFRDAVVAQKRRGKKASPKKSASRRSR